MATHRNTKIMKMSFILVYFFFFQDFAIVSFFSLHSIIHNLAFAFSHLVDVSHKMCFEVQAWTKQDKRRLHHPQSIPVVFTLFRGLGLLVSLFLFPGHMSACLGQVFQLKSAIRFSNRLEMPLGNAGTTGREQEMSE